VLDLCAAPGGKSTLVNSLLSEKSVLVSNELVKKRADILVQNLSRWGTANTIVTGSNPSQFSACESLFDVIIVDAPCSGSGLFRKQPEAIDEWSQNLVQMCSLRQKEILNDVLPSLSENGILLYSTCSYSEEENEMIVKWLIGEKELDYIPIDLKSEWGVIDSGMGYRFYPHLTKSEGFFCAVLRKKGGTRRKNKLLKMNDFLLKNIEKSLLSEFIDTNNGHSLKINEQVHLVPEHLFSMFSSIRDKLYLKKLGVRLGEIKGKDLVPSQELAWFCNLGYGKVADLDLENALLFLKKQSFNMEASGMGLNVAKYKGHGLGWMKVLQGRINNYLPSEIRILN
jgi:NOL1/NOP2/fmu family ribosome biogenesis protein